MELPQTRTSSSSTRVEQTISIERARGGLHRICGTLAPATLDYPKYCPNP